MESINTYYINKTNLINNIKKIKSRLNSKTKVCAVVKANAYGVGVKEVVSIIKDYVDYYAVANIKEAIEVRGLDQEKNILVLGFVRAEDLKIASEKNISITIISKEYLFYILKYLEDKNFKIKVHVKINTGLNRFGFANEEIEKNIDLIKNNHIEIEGCYTHFATKEKDKNFIKIQFEKFRNAIQFFNNKVIKHCSNSYATLNNPEMQLDMVRVGFSLYGMEDNSFELKPVVSIKSKIINIIKLKKGETLGYDRTFVAEEETKIAVIPIGYADGFSRNLSNKFKLFLNGKFVSVVGRVCMDVCFVDIKNILVNIGDEVEIMGEKIQTINYCDILNTSSYEILLNFNKVRCNRIICQ